MRCPCGCPDTELWRGQHNDRWYRLVLARAGYHLRFEVMVSVGEDEIWELEFIR